MCGKLALVRHSPTPGVARGEWRTGSEVQRSVTDIVGFEYHNIDTIL